MTIQSLLQKYGYSNSVICPTSLDDIEKMIYYVYILLYDQQAIIAGHGKKNRASILFDKPKAPHVKSFLSRVFVVYGDKPFSRFLIPCQTKKEAQEIETIIHREIGGNVNQIPKEIEEKLYANITKGSSEEKLLRQAQISFYSGIDDLKRWRKAGIITDTEWGPIQLALKL